jgi:hypothetical protein
MLGDLLLIQAIILFVIPRNTNLGTEGKLIFFYRIQILSEN